MSPEAYGPPSPDDFPRIARLLSDAFAGPLPGSEDWARSHGPSHLRVWRHDSHIQAALARIPMGQFFGGRSVLTSGIAGVAVALEARGQGVARHMLEACLREIAAEGVALTTLYASTRAFYRQVGYETAGVRMEHRAPADRFRPATPAPSLPIREITTADQPAMTACYREWARNHSGPLDRGVYIWNRLWKLRDEAFRGIGVFQPQGLTGYVLFAQRRNPDTGRHDIAVSDAAALNPAAWNAIMAFLGNFGTMGDHVIFHGGPSHPIAMRLSQHRWTAARIQEAWMLRVANVRAALVTRGYPAGLAASITLHVADPLIPINNGPWALDVRDGRGTVEPTAAAGPTVRIDIRGLSAVYSGFITPHAAAQLELCEGDEASLRLLGSIFASPGGTPWMSDFF